MRSIESRMSVDERILCNSCCAIVGSNFGGSRHCSVTVFWPLIVSHRNGLFVASEFVEDVLNVMPCIYYKMGTAPPDIT